MNGLQWKTTFNVDVCYMDMGSQTCNVQGYGVYCEFDERKQKKKISLCLPEANIDA